jgi:tRNA-binding EMAP/Myf-like protein
MEEIIDINEFAKLDLRIGKIENAERVEGSKGMILAVDVNGKPILLHPDVEVPAGSRIR